MKNGRPERIRGKLHVAFVLPVIRGGRFSREKKIDFVCGSKSNPAPRQQRPNPKKNMLYGTHAGADYNLTLCPLQS
jgi:hypothetical protein